MKLKDLMNDFSKMKDLSPMDISDYVLPKDTVISIKDLPLYEMTLKRSSDMPDNIGMSNIEYVQKSGKHMGDQDGKKIFGLKLKNNYYIYGIENDDKITSIVCFHLGTIFDNDYAVIDVAYTLPEYRKINDMRRIMWFIKAQEHLKLMSGGEESSSAISYIDKLFKNGAFSPKWLNLKTGEIKDYTDKTIKFRSSENFTDWRLIVESINHEQINEQRFMDRRKDVPVLYKQYIFEDK